MHRLSVAAGPHNCCPSQHKSHRASCRSSANSTRPRPPGPTTERRSCFCREASVREQCKPSTRCRLCSRRVRLRFLEMCSIGSPVSPPRFLRTRRRAERRGVQRVMSALRLRERPDVRRLYEPRSAGRWLHPLHKRWLCHRQNIRRIQTLRAHSCMVQSKLRCAHLPERGMSSKCIPFWRPVRTLCPVRFRGRSGRRRQQAASEPEWRREFRKPI